MNPKFLAVKIFDQKTGLKKWSNNGGGCSNLLTAGSAIIINICFYGFFRIREMWHTRNTTRPVAKLVFCYIPNLCTNFQVPQLVLIFLPPLPWPGFEPTSEELHRPGTFWRTLYQLTHQAEVRRTACKIMSVQFGGICYLVCWPICAAVFFKYNRNPMMKVFFKLANVNNFKTCLSSRTKMLLVGFEPRSRLMLSHMSQSHCRSTGRCFQRATSRSSSG